jgi:hypothetical protein
MLKLPSTLNRAVERPDRRSVKQADTPRRPGV